MRLRGIGAFLLLPMFACDGGENPDPPSFEACGGEIVEDWRFTSATVLEGGDDCTAPDGEPPISGFLNFNPEMNRVSLNVNVRIWKESSFATSCGFQSAYGGFWRTNGARVCVGGNQMELDSFPCDETDELGQGPRNAKAEFCVKDGKLQLKSSSLFGARFPVLFELEPAP